MRPYKAVNLDFEARVPVPFSIFPSSYRDDDKKESGKTSTSTTTHEELNLHLPHHKPGREGSQVSSYSAAAADLPPRREQNRYSEEEVFVTREEDHYRRPGVHREEYYREELKEQQPRYSQYPSVSSALPCLVIPCLCHHTAMSNAFCPHVCALTNPPTHSAERALSSLHMNSAQSVQAACGSTAAWS